MSCADYVQLRARPDRGTYLGTIMRILVTGGAGFVGSALAKYLVSAFGLGSITVFDNLRRRGSEQNVQALSQLGVDFVHGDVRLSSDLEQLHGTFDVLVEASAEPSVLAGMGDSPRYVIDTNFGGAVNCLEFARARCRGLIFLSTSRVYSINPLINLPLKETQERFDLMPSNDACFGVSHLGVTESFPTDSQRSYYGSSKLAAELICQEYAAHAKLPVVINRCGVIAGPGQFGKTDQGVFTLWVARHHFGRALRYTGFGGRGYQVRDLLHPLDLCELIVKQIAVIERIAGEVFNVGGGREGSVSLKEYTTLSQEATGRQVEITSDSTTNPVDIPWYITDGRKVREWFDWQPSRSPRTIASDIASWVKVNERSLDRLIL
jgi:CDP-paratose 2-epimerase